MRPAVALVALLAAAAPAACGGGDTPASPRPVRLSVTSPGDRAVVHGDHIDIQGTVRPSTATVIVRGQRAAVSGGAFRASVSLEAGTNVIDVLASDGAARPALTAIRVRRDITVSVPDLLGLPVDEAKTALGDAGLKADVQQGGGFLDRLLGGTQTVCDTTPAGGTQVDRGTKVTVVAAKAC